MHADFALISGTYQTASGGPYCFFLTQFFLCDAIKARYTLAIKSTVAENGDKSATKSTVADTVDFVAGFGNKSATELN